jgi:TolB-like protein/tetratricopeptide (TPR) repeat protein
VAKEEQSEPLSGQVKRLESEVGPHAHHPLLHLPLLEQLKQRNIFRVAVLYVVICWLILDPLHVIFHMAGVPEWVNRLVLILMAVGFPAVAIFAWVYEITPGGLKPTVEVPHHESIRTLTGRRLDRAIIAVLAVALAYFVIDKFWISRHPAASDVTAATTARAPPAPAATAAAFAPPPHSIAVLPFVNLSTDKEQEYFSDGLTEELLNSLAAIDGLQVAARTSSFSFKERPDIVTVAHKLNVASVLEGSVRRSARTVRITAQLINAATGFHLWSKTYDRDLGDVLKLQTEIATEVATALKVTLLGDLTAKIEVGGTHNPAAFDAYLRASKVMATGSDAKSLQQAITMFTEAIDLDPGYASAIAGRSMAVGSYATEFAVGEDRWRAFGESQSDAQRAIALAPDLADGHLALARSFENGALDFVKASEEYERALALAPGSIRVLRSYARFARSMGRGDAGLTIARRTVLLDPLDHRSHMAVGGELLYARRFQEAIPHYDDSITLTPDDPTAYGFRGLTYYLLGDLQNARTSCEMKSDFWVSQVCLAVVYHKLGRQTDAETMLAKLKAALGDDDAYQYAQIYAQWGDASKALQWLDRALKLRDAGLADLKTDPLMDPLRNEPRFQAIERSLKFPT